MCDEEVKRVRVAVSQGSMSSPSVNETVLCEVLHPPINPTKSVPAARICKRRLTFGTLLAVQGVGCPSPTMGSLPSSLTVDLPFDLALRYSPVPVN